LKYFLKQSRLFLLEMKYYINEKKLTNFKSPDLKKLQEVVIDERTKIYIATDEDPEQARKRYLSRLKFKKRY